MFSVTVKKVTKSEYVRFGSTYMNKQLYQLSAKEFNYYLLFVNNKLSYRNNTTKQLFEVEFTPVISDE